MHIVGADAGDGVRLVAVHIDPVFCGVIDMNFYLDGGDVNVWIRTQKGG